MKITVFSTVTPVKVQFVIEELLDFTSKMVLTPVMFLKMQLW